MSGDRGKAGKLQRALARERSKEADGRICFIKFKDPSRCTVSVPCFFWRRPQKVLAAGFESKQLVYQRKRMSRKGNGPIIEKKITTYKKDIASFAWHQKRPDFMCVEEAFRIHFWRLTDSEEQVTEKLLKPPQITSSVKFAEFTLVFRFRSHFTRWFVHFGIQSGLAWAALNESTPRLNFRPAVENGRLMFSDSSSSRQLIARKGLRKVRHLDVDLLWAMAKPFLNAKKFRDKDRGPKLYRKIVVVAVGCTCCCIIFAQAVSGFRSRR